MRHSDAEVMENGKIRCTLTGHEVTPQLATVQAYWMGNKKKRPPAGAGSGAEPQVSNGFHCEERKNLEKESPPASHSI